MKVTDVQDTLLASLKEEFDLANPSLISAIDNMKTVARRMGMPSNDHMIEMLLYQAILNEHPKKDFESARLAKLAMDIYHHVKGEVQ